MPQLDSNTFLTQYFAIITLVVVVYSILGYVVLPILLRSLLIRNLVVQNSATSSSKQPASVALSLPPLAHKVSVIAVASLMNAIIQGVLVRHFQLVHIISNTFSFKSGSQFNTNKEVASFFISDVSLTYLIMFLTIDNLIDLNE